MSDTENKNTQASEPAAVAPSAPKPKAKSKANGKTVAFSIRFGNVSIPAPTPSKPDALETIYVPTDKKGMPGKPIAFEVDAELTELIDLLDARPNIDRAE